MTDELQVIKQQLTNITKENNDLIKDRNLITNDRVEQLERQSYDAAQYIRRNNIEISGVPEIFREEDTLEGKIVEICAAYDVSFEKRDIEACHRLPKKKNT